MANVVSFLSSRHVNLALLTSERAWAQAMSIKASHTADQKGISGRTRSHIISRLTKAARAADQLVEALSQTEVSGASTTDVLEARAYAAMIRGAARFEQQIWQHSLQSYSTARIIYSILSTSTKGDIFKDLLSETIDPSIRYAAYQLKMPRTVPIPTIARNNFPNSDSALVDKINKVDPEILKQSGDGSAKGTAETEGLPKTLTWRSREVKIEDAQIASAWGSVSDAKERLSENLEEMEDSSPYEQAGAYDEILTATQDAVDATKTAIDELKAEGVGQGDPRMQSLQVTRTAVNFEMISWRIGRNRVLTGSHDGAVEEYEETRRRRKAKKDQADAKDEKDLSTGKKLGKLKERVALLDGTLQNLQSIKELPGVATDDELAAKIEASVKYFEALSYVDLWPPLPQTTPSRSSRLTTPQEPLYCSLARYHQQRHQRIGSHKPCPQT
jgi:signal recognition particle subunit SRP68